MSRGTELLDFIRDLIRQDGPIGLDRYMALALGHPALGYYMTRDPFGVLGDFTTAPEISQMFGELIGLWAAETWRLSGSPTRFNLVELGPGRGTLMADVLRAARLVPAFRDALELHFVETSPVLRERQAVTLAPLVARPQWHAGIDSLPEGPLLVIANEFFDALPVRHYQRTERGWCERMVGLGQTDSLVFGLSPEPEPRLTLEAPLGAMLEIGAEAQRLMQSLAGRVARQGGAALVIDYGHAASATGETLQALRGHAPADPLEAPGEADLTAHVDFAALARAAEAAGGGAHGPVTQGDFLRAIGIEARAAQLQKSRPDQAEAVATALQRLTGSSPGPRPGMGTLFKVLAVTPSGAAAPPGF